jgi:TyrR family helix-turn-helix protein
MRIDVFFTDRVGIAQEILATSAQRGYNVTAVEVDPPHVFIEAPQLDDAGLSGLRADLLRVPGVLAVLPVAMLPGAQRRLYLDALLASQTDPVFALDADGVVVVANRAAHVACGPLTTSVIGQPFQNLIGLAHLMTLLSESDYHLPVTEVELNGETYMMETTALQEANTRVAGAVITLRAPSRMGEQLSALQNYSTGGFEAILGASPMMQQLKQRAARMALVDAPLLVTGETGTGKELLAHACHAASGRSLQPFFALNCAALPENLAESELFGYSSGAFTGALRGGKPGLLELADRGTVFLDEVGEMSAYLQAKLLRFLNDGSFRRVGGDRELKVNVRIISATHRNLDEMVTNGDFRQDLLYRLNVLNLHMPALRARPDDILLLVEAILTKACAQARRAPMRLTAAASAALLTNPWAGNVRQLQNVIFRAVTMSERPFIDLGDLELASAASPVSPGNPADPDLTGQVGTLAQAMAEFEKALLQRLHREFPSTRRLAKRLGSSHSVIAARLRRYGIGDA